MIRPPRFPVEQWRLANGLKVVVQPDHAWPLVASMMCYEAGSRCDPPARSGLAHVCEHLAFDGPSRTSDRAFPVRIERAGGTARAATTPDRLCFSAVFPRSELAALLAVEAERMARPLDPQDVGALDVQRRVLAEELRQRSQTRIRAAAIEQIHRLLFPERHPYHRPPSGEPNGIRAVSADDVRRFAADHFSPANAVLVLAGDVPAASAAELVSRAFEGVARGAESPRQERLELHPAGDVRSLRAPAPVSSAHVHLAWPVAGLGQEDWYLAALLVRVLSAGRSSLLARELADRAGLAEEVRGHLVTMRDASTLVLVAVGARGVESRRLEQGLIEATDRLLSSDFPVTALVRARRKASSEHYFVVQNLERRADLCASFSCHLDAPDRLEGEAQRYWAPDRDAIAAFGARLRRAHTRAMLSLLPVAEAA